MVGLYGRLTILLGYRMERSAIDNYGSPAEEGRQASHHDWKSVFGYCIADLPASSPTFA